MTKCVENHVAGRFPCSPVYRCDQCERELGRSKPSLTFWAYTDIYYFCSHVCRKQWLNQCLKIQRLIERREHPVV
jgi:hypothetical protein